MTTNLWVKQKWYDYKLRWDPEEYGGVEMLYVPSEQIWLPDVVLFNNWDGNYEVTLMTKATLKYNGEVFWEPPAIYKSSCEMNVEYFPYDEQSCFMKFGSWTYNGAQVDLKHLDQVSFVELWSLTVKAPMCLRVSFRFMLIEASCDSLEADEYWSNLISTFGWRKIPSMKLNIFHWTRLSRPSNHPTY